MRKGKHVRASPFEQRSGRHPQGAATDANAVRKRTPRVESLAKQPV